MYVAIVTAVPSTQITKPGAAWLSVRAGEPCSHLWYSYVDYQERIMIMKRRREREGA
jgi:hypothetical protein